MAGQIKRKNYRIPNSLTHSAGDITAEFDDYTFNVTLSGLTANTLYYLYIRDDSGIDLFFSTDAPSVYQATFTDALLVGAFYSDNASNFLFFADKAVNEYSARIANSGAPAITSQAPNSHNGIASVALNTTGTVDITFTSDIFGEIPATDAQVVDSFVNGSTDITIPTLSGCTVRTRQAGTATNLDFTFYLNRQGADYREKLTTEQLARL